ncbi:unnamed protein product [Schistocephalus solidus]|uniref:Uncharacterized protein n=1 Tax=Schistocephalus solidus TaxID=70667 RepID=A0A183SY06_SCHSO|nr:unnamed protein product [Schistocephalus solidus]
MAGLIQLWAFLREANMEVFQELRTLEVPLQSLYRITEAVQQTVRQIERATYMSRSGDQGLIANWYRPLASEVSDLREDEQHFAQKPQEQLQQIFDENCVDQTEHIGMLHSVSRLTVFLDILSSTVLVMAFIFLLAENLYANLWRKRGMRRKRVSVNFRRLGLNHAHTQPKRNESNERKHMASACGDETVSSTDGENGGRLLQAYKLHSRDGPPAFIYNLPSHPVSLSNAVGLTAASVTLPKCSSHAGIQGVSVLMDRIPRSVERSRTALTAQPSPLMQGGSRLTASTTNASITADAQTPSFEIRHARHPMWPIYEVTNNQVLPTPVTTVNSAEAFTMDVV